MPKMDKQMRYYLNASSIGMSMVAAVAIGTGIGYYLDKYFDTKPYLTLIFMVLGVIAAFKNVIYFVKRAGVYDKEDEK
jgi:ATP synthase protein I